MTYSSERNSPDFFYFTYKNHKNEVEKRCVAPKTVWFGRTEFHKDQQWFLRAYDYNRKGIRDFALNDFVHPRVEVTFKAEMERIQEVLEEAAKHVENAVNEVANSRATKEMLAYSTKWWKEHAEFLQKEMAHAKVALDFYADKGNWQVYDDGSSDVSNDSGAKAQRAVKRIETLGNS